MMETDLDLKKFKESPTIEKENIPTSEATPEPRVKISIETPHDLVDNETPPSEEGASFSTPLQLTVKDRVKEYNHRTGQGDDSLSSLSGGNRSLASSQSSLRGVGHFQSFPAAPAGSQSCQPFCLGKDGKEWVLAASACNQPALIRLLQVDKHMVNYKFPFNGFTALHFAAKMNRPELCKCLIENGATADAKTYAGQTPLHLACQHECREAIDYLMKVPGKASHTPDYSGKLPHELIRSRDSFADVLFKMSSSGVEKRGSFLGEYPTPRQLLGIHKPASESTGASLSSGSWLSGVRASFRGKSSHQPKIKSSGSNLYVPGSQPAGSRVSRLFQS